MSEVLHDVQGEESITAALVDLLNDCPFISFDISFASLPEKSGIAIYPTGGSAILSERKSITDHVTQNCAYSFAVVYRTFGSNDSRKQNAKELLDNVGRWLERQKVKVGSTEYQLEGYPELTSGRVIRQITRQSSAAIDTISDTSEIWGIRMRCEYRNEFDLTPIF